MGLDRDEGGYGGMGIRLILLANSAAIDIFAHKLCELQPSEFSSNKLMCLEITGMTSGLMVVAMDEDGMAEGIVQEDIDASFVCENMVVKLPVRKT